MLRPDELSEHQSTSESSMPHGEVSDVVNRPSYYILDKPIEYRSTSESSIPHGEVSDMVNHPSHYTSDKPIECFDWILLYLTEEETTGYLKGNILKYIWRYEAKYNPVEDLEKARWYLDKLIEITKEDKLYETQE